MTLLLDTLELSPIRTLFHFLYNALKSNKAAKEEGLDAKYSKEELETFVQNMLDKEQDEEEQDSFEALMLHILQSLKEHFESEKLQKFFAHISENPELAYPKNFTSFVRLFDDYMTKDKTPDESIRFFDSIANEILENEKSLLDFTDVNIINQLLDLSNNDLDKPEHKAKAALLIQYLAHNHFIQDEYTSIGNAAHITKSYPHKTLSATIKYLLMPGAVDEKNIPSNSPEFGLGFLRQFKTNYDIQKQSKQMNGLSTEKIKDSNVQQQLCEFLSGFAETNAYITPLHDWLTKISVNSVAVGLLPLALSACHELNSGAFSTEQGIEKSALSVFEKFLSELVESEKNRIPEEIVVSFREALERGEAKKNQNQISNSPNDEYNHSEDTNYEMLPDDDFEDPTDPTIEDPTIEDPTIEDPTIEDPTITSEEIPHEEEISPLEQYVDSAISSEQPYEVVEATTTNETADQWQNESVVEATTTDLEQPSLEPELPSEKEPDEISVEQPSPELATEEKTSTSVDSVDISNKEVSEVSTEESQPAAVTLTNIENENKADTANDLITYSKAALKFVFDNTFTNEPRVHYTPSNRIISPDGLDDNISIRNEIKDLKSMLDAKSSPLAIKNKIHRIKGDCAYAGFFFPLLLLWICDKVMYSAIQISSDGSISKKSREFIEDTIDYVHSIMTTESYPHSAESSANPYAWEIEYPSIEQRAIEVTEGNFKFREDEQFIAYTKDYPQFLNFLNEADDWYAQRDGATETIDPDYEEPVSINQSNINETFIQNLVPQSTLGIQNPQGMMPNTVMPTADITFTIQGVFCGGRHILAQAWLNSLNDIRAVSEQLENLSSEYKILMQSEGATHISIGLEPDLFKSLGDALFRLNLKQASVVSFKIQSYLQLLSDTSLPELTNLVDRTCLALEPLMIDEDVVQFSQEDFMFADAALFVLAQKQQMDMIVYNKPDLDASKQGMIEAFEKILTEKIGDAMLGITNQKEDYQSVANLIDKQITILKDVQEKISLNNMKQVSEQISALNQLIIEPERGLARRCERAYYYAKCAYYALNPEAFPQGEATPQTGEHRKKMLGSEADQPLNNNSNGWLRKFLGKNKGNQNENK